MQILCSRSHCVLQNCDNWIMKCLIKSVELLERGCLIWRRDACHVACLKNIRVGLQSKQWYDHVFGQTLAYQSENFIGLYFKHVAKMSWKFYLENKPRWARWFQEEEYSFECWCWLNVIKATYQIQIFYWKERNLECIEK